MINRIKKLFSSSQDASGQSEIVKRHPDELPLAAAALLVEAARLDEEYDEVENHNSLIRTWDELNESAKNYNTNS